MPYLGQTKVELKLPVSSGFSNCMYGNNEFIATQNGNNAGIYISSDGISWQEKSGISLQAWDLIAYNPNNGYFLISKKGGNFNNATQYIGYYKNGTADELTLSAFSLRITNIQDITYCQDSFIILCNEGIAYLNIDDKISGILLDIADFRSESSSSIGELVSFSITNNDGNNIMVFGDDNMLYSITVSNNNATITAHVEVSGISNSNAITMRNILGAVMIIVDNSSNFYCAYFGTEREDEVFHFRIDEISSGAYIVSNYKYGTNYIVTCSNSNEFATGGVFSNISDAYTVPLALDWTAITGSSDRIIAVGKSESYLMSIDNGESFSNIYYY